MEQRHSCTGPFSKHRSQVQNCEHWISMSLAMPATTAKCASPGVDCKNAMVISRRPRFRQDNGKPGLQLMLHSPRACRYPDRILLSQKRHDLILACVRLPLQCASSREPTRSLIRLRLCTPRSADQEVSIPRRRVSCMECNKQMLFLFCKALYKRKF